MEDPQEQVCVRYAYRTRTIRAPKCTVRGFGFSRVDFRRGSPGGARVRRRGCHFWRFRCVDHPPGGGRVGTPQELLLRASGGGPGSLAGRPTTTPIFFQGSSKYFLKNLFQDSNPPPLQKKESSRKDSFFETLAIKNTGGAPVEHPQEQVCVRYAYHTRTQMYGTRIWVLPGGLQARFPRGRPGAPARVPLLAISMRRNRTPPHPPLDG